MNPLQQQSRSKSDQPEPQGATARGSAALPAWRLNVLRVGYLVMGGGLVITKWPQFLAREPWELKEGTVLTMLVVMSVLALLGLRYPRKMLPILLFEVGWKLTWLGVVAFPLWSDGNLTGATREQVAAVLWVVIIIAVIPWRHIISQFALARGERWH